MSDIKAKRVLRLDAVKKISGLSRSTIYSLMKKGKFPQNFRIAERAVGWAAEDIDQWYLEKFKRPRINDTESSKD